MSLGKSRCNHAPRVGGTSVDVSLFLGPYTRATPRNPVTVSVPICAQQDFVTGSTCRILLPSRLIFRGSLRIIRIFTKLRGLSHAPEEFKDEDTRGFHVVTGGRLYIRHGNALMAYDVKAR